MQEKIILLNCLSDDIISGGNIYNKQLIQGLENLGIDAVQEIVDPAQPWIDKIEGGAIYLLDSILLRYSLDWEKLHKFKVVILLHMCPSLDSDLSEAEKDIFRQSELTAYQSLPIISTGVNNLNFISEDLNISTRETVVISPAVSSAWERCRALPDKPTKLLTIGSVSNGKGLHRTIQVLNKIKHIEWTWSHYGPIRDEELLIELQKHLVSYGISDRVQFYGEIEHAKINNILLDHHLLLHLSDHENYGMAIAESIAAGLPVVYTPVGEYREWTNNGLGCGTNSFDEVDIAKLVSSIMLDKQEYTVMVEQLRSIDIDTWDNVAKSTLQFLESNLC